MLLLVLIILGFAGMAIGNSMRGRPLSGFLLGFLIGPIGWIIILALQDARLRCRHCGSVLNHGATICHACRNPLFEKKQTHLQLDQLSECIDQGLIDGEVKELDEVLDWIGPPTKKKHS